MPKAPGVLTRTADGRGYLIQFRRSEGSTRDTIAELRADVYCGRERLWAGGVGLTDYGLPQSYTSRYDPYDAPKNYWHTILMRVALPMLQVKIASNTLDLSFYMVEADEIQRYFDTYGPKNRPCEFFDDAQPMSSYCVMAMERNADVQITRAFCRTCDMPELFARCKHLNVVEAIDMSSHSGSSLRFGYDCARGEAFKSPAECMNMPCFEHTTVEAPRSVVSDEILRVFEQHLGHVEMILRNDYPEAFAELCAAFEHLSDSSEPEELAQAAASCRRVLSDLADQLFPASNEVRNDRKLDESKYVNRLWAYAEARMESSTNAALVGAGLEHLGRRIDAVNKLACKGDHDDWTVDEAYRCAVQTLLVVSDLLVL